MNIKYLIHNIAMNHGINGLAEKLGQNENTFKSKVNPNISSHHIYAEELPLIAAAADTDEIAKYFADQRGLMCISKPNFDGLSDNAILDLFLKLQKEMGDMSKEIYVAMSDGEISWDEMMKIQKEYDEFVTAGAEIMSRLRTYMAASEERKQRRIQSVTND